MSFAQEQVWFLSDRDPSGFAFSDGRCFDIKGPLDEARLRAAVDVLVARHEPLRTSFAVTAPGHPGPVQRIHPAGCLPVLIEDVPADEADVIERARQLIDAPFDIAAGPLARMSLLRAAADRHVLVFVLHYLVADGWSMEVFCTELSLVYAALTAGRPPGLPALTVQYADWTMWQREELSGARRGELEQWWRSELTGMPRYLALPGRAAAGPWRPGQRLSQVIPARTADGVHQLARAQRTTASAVLMAACAITLGAASGQRRLVIGTPASGRDRPELQHALGAFLNVLPIGVDLTGDPSFGELTRQVAGRLGRAADHQDLPFSQLVAALAPPRAFPRMPLVQACFTYRPPGSLGALEIAGCETTEVVPPTAKGKFELTLRVDELSGRPEAWAEFDATLLEPAVAQRLLAGYGRVLEAAVAAPGSAVSWLTARAGLSRRPGGAFDPGRGGPTSGHAPEVGRAGPGASPSAAPAGPVISAARLADVAAEVLGFSADPTADLFMSGANSLLIAALVRRIEAEAGYRIGLRDVCRTPTLAAIAGLLRAATQSRPPSVTRQGPRK